MGLIDELAQAIERYESGGDPNSLSYRNNNPGNLRSWGSYPVVGGYVRFPDLETGRAALRRQVELNVGRGLSLEEFFGGRQGTYAGYAPAADANNPSGYAATVGGWLGIDIATPLNELGAPPNPQMPQLTAAGAKSSDGRPAPGKARG